jgi:hypothetical protein
MAEYVAELEDRISGWDGLPLTKLGMGSCTLRRKRMATQRQADTLTCRMVACSAPPGRLLDVATMKMTDDHHAKRSERYIMLFENALVPGQEG